MFLISSRVIKLRQLIPYKKVCVYVHVCTCVCLLASGLALDFLFFFGAAEQSISNCEDFLRCQKAFFISQIYDLNRVYAFEFINIVLFRIIFFLMLLFSHARKPDVLLSLP